MTKQAHILALGAEAPTLSPSQDLLLEKVIRSLPADDRGAPLIRRIYSGSQIETRHSVVDDYANDTLSGPFFGENFPNTAARHVPTQRSVQRKGTGPAHAAAEKALDDWGRPREDVTHVISVSCTGMIAPGIEFLLIDSLNLPRSTQRLGINFMGCFGAFKGLAVAKALALESPTHRVLVVCTELCSLHFHLDGQVDTHVANAIFADGAAAVVVGCVPCSQEKSWMEIIRQGSLALESSQHLMTWEATDDGLVMWLSPEVPHLIDEHVLRFARGLLGGALDFSDCDWAVHPGGKPILQAIEKPVPWFRARPILLGRSCENSATCPAPRFSLCSIGSGNAGPTASSPSAWDSDRDCPWRASCYGGPRRELCLPGNLAGTD